MTRLGRWRSPELFERALEELERSGADAVIAAAPVSDTIKEVGEDGQTVARTLERSRLWAVQTPQVFRRAALERALDRGVGRAAARRHRRRLADRAGRAARCASCASGPENIKITTAADLHVAERLLSERAG